MHGETLNYTDVPLQLSVFANNKRINKKGLHVILETNWFRRYGAFLTK